MVVGTTKITPTRTTTALSHRSSLLLTLFSFLLCYSFFHNVFKHQNENGQSALFVQAFELSCENHMGGTMGFGKCYRYVNTTALTVVEGTDVCQSMGFDGLVVFTQPKIHEPQEQQQGEGEGEDDSGGDNEELAFVRSEVVGDDSANFWTGFYRRSGHWLYRDHRQSVAVGA